VESFTGKVRDVLFAREIFDSVFEAHVLYDDWCDAYAGESRAATIPRKGAPT
jgi:hypothetical protein